MESTHIQYVMHSYNVWIGCQEVSDGCRRCHAKRDADTRFHKVVWGGPRQLVSPASRLAPLRFYMKQVSATHPKDSMIPPDLLVREFPT